MQKRISHRIEPSNSFPRPISKVKVAKKIAEYPASGVKEVWRVEPEIETVTVYKSLTEIRIFTKNELLTCEEILPNFSLALGEIFIS